jgi:hypothetical protein
MQERPKFLDRDITRINVLALHKRGRPRVQPAPRAKNASKVFTPRVAPMRSLAPFQALFLKTGTGVFLLRLVAGWGPMQALATRSAMK